MWLPKKKKINSKELAWTKKEEAQMKIAVPLTFSIKDTTTLAKQGKVGTRGFKTTRGTIDICKSVNWQQADSHFQQMSCIAVYILL